MCSSKVGERGQAVLRRASHGRPFLEINAKLRHTPVGEASFGKIRENRVPDSTAGGTILLGSQAPSLGSD